MAPLSRTLLALVCLSLFSSFALGIKFNLDRRSFVARHEKCLGEHISINTLVTGSYKLQPTSGRQISPENHGLTIYAPSHQPVFAHVNQLEGTFGFTTEEDGEYRFCVHHDGREQLVVTLTARVGVEAMDFDEVAKKENIEGMQLQLRYMEEVVDEIDREMKYMRERDDRMRNTNESTGFRISFLTVLSLLIFAGTSVWQLTYLKKYFRSKKLI